MKKINLYETYSFGKQMAALSRISSETTVAAVAFPLWFARQQLQQLVGDDSPLLSSSKRAATKTISAITEVIPEDLSVAFSAPQDAKLEWKAQSITSSVSALETVLGNDMPDIPAYMVSQKGIYRTEDLINRAEHQLTPSVRALLPVQARTDIQEAGKCLAYALGTACTFHLWRAVESVMRSYYTHLTQSSFSADKINRNWGAYIKALNDKGADTKVTSFLNHIRDEYRNPQTHPDEVISVDEAQRLFSVALSSIDQMLRRMAGHP